MRARILFCAILVFVLASAVFAQGGPPPKVKERIGKSNEGMNPFVTEEEIIARFEKDLGVTKDVYQKVKTQVAGMKESSEGGHDLTEKPTSEVMCTLIVTAAKVTSGERTGRFKPDQRAENILGESKKIIERRRSHTGWGGLAEEAGLEDPGQLFSIQRALEFGQTLTPDVLRKIAPTATQTQTTPATTSK